MLEQTVSIIGIGPTSSQFVVQLYEQIAKGPKSKAIIAVGVYGDNSDEITNKLRRLRAKLLKVDPDQQAPNKIESDIYQLAYQLIDDPAEIIFWVIDAEWLFVCQNILHLLRGRLHSNPAKIIGLCFTSRGLGENLDRITNIPPNNQTAFGIIDGFITDKTWELAFVVKSNSQLANAELQDKLLAKSLAGMLVPSAHNVNNTTFLQVVQSLQNGHSKLIAFALGSVGLTLAKEGFWRKYFWGILRWFPRFIRPDPIAARTKDLIHAMATNYPMPMTTVGPVQYAMINEVSIHIISPLTKVQLRSAIPRIPQLLAQEFELAHRIAVYKGKGIKLKHLQLFEHFFGDHYLQVCFLFSVDMAAIRGQSNGNAQ